MIIDYNIYYMSKILLCQSLSHTLKERMAGFHSSSQKSQSPVQGSVVSELLETWNIMVAGVCEGGCSSCDRQETKSEITSKGISMKYHLLMFSLSSRTVSPGNQTPNILVCGRAFLMSTNTFHMF